MERIEKVTFGIGSYKIKGTGMKAYFIYVLALVVRGLIMILLPIIHLILRLNGRRGVYYTENERTKNINGDKFYTEYSKEYKISTEKL